MKKFIKNWGFIILLAIATIFLLITVSCNKYVSQNIYERTYSIEEAAITDIYSQLYTYGLDSIPLNDWITNIMFADTMKIEQKMIRKIIDNKTNYTFIYTKYIPPIKCICPELTQHQFLIRYQGKKE